MNFSDGFKVSRRNIKKGLSCPKLRENLDDVCRQLASGLEEMNMPQRTKLCSQLIGKLIVDSHSAEFHYKFPVSRNCSRSGEARRILV